MEAGYEYIALDSPKSAQEWATGIMDAINSLQSFPCRCPLPPESRLLPEEIRHLIYGNGQGAYRILFTIVRDAVSILHIRHGAQDMVKPGA